MEQAAHIAYRFGGFRLDPARRLLFDRDGQMVPLKPRAFDTLLYLVEHRGVLVERRTLLDAVWPHVVVEGNNLDQAISGLRRVFGESRDDHRFIVTEPARGYRFVAPVEVVSGVETDHGREAGLQREGDETPSDARIGALVPPAVASDADVRRRSLAPWLAGAAVAVLVAAIPTALHLREVVATSRVDAVPELSVAVLPFVNMTGANDELFSDGLTDELISRLGRVPDLRVSALTSSRYFKDKKELPATIAKMLGVRYLVEGSVRLSDDRLHVTVRLLDQKRDVLLWQEPYDRELGDFIAMQDQIALAVVDHLQVTLLGDARKRFGRHPTDNADAEHLFSLARPFAQSAEVSEMDKAIGYYERATQLDPKYAAAFAAWADTLMRRAQPAEVPPQEAAALARGLLQRALEADPDSAEAHAILGFMEHNAGNCDRARVQLDAAEEINPSNAEVLIYQSRHHINCDWDPDRILEYARRAAELDPMNPWAVLHVTQAYYHRFEYANALREVDHFIERFPNYGFAYWSRWWILDDLERYQDALVTAQKAVQQESFNGTRTSLAIAYARLGRIDEARAIYKEIVDGKQYWSPSFRALLLLALREPDAAMDALEQAHESHDDNLAAMLHFKALRALHGTPRFEKLVDELHHRAQVEALKKVLGA